MLTTELKPLLKAETAQSLNYSESIYKLISIHLLSTLAPYHPISHPKSYGITYDFTRIEFQPFRLDIINILTFEAT